MAQLKDYINFNSIDEYESFNFSEIKEVLQTLANTDAIDLAHAEMLQQKALRGADIVSDYLGKIGNILGVAEAKCNSLRNKKALEYKSSDGVKTTAAAKQQAAESDQDVENALVQIAKIKASKVFLEKKYDILIKTHHHFKDLAAGYKKAIGTQFADDGGKITNSKAGSGWR